MLLRGVMADCDGDKAAGGGPRLSRGARGGAASVRRVVRAAQRVLRPELWGSFEITEAGGSVSIRVHRVPNQRLSAGAATYVPRGSPLTPPPSMTRKQRKAIMSQRRGILTRFAVRGVLSASHPLRAWARFGAAIARARADRSARVAEDMMGDDELTGATEAQRPSSPTPTDASPDGSTTKRAHDSPGARQKRRPTAGGLRPGGLARGFLT